MTRLINHPDMVLIIEIRLMLIKLLLSLVKLQIEDQSR